ncbi:MAG: hypothetical protein R2867_19910 [Caldilineaceae bacterium]
MGSGGGGEPGANLEDLRWYMASYASVKAGELSQIHRDYAHSRPYYLSFFYLVQEDDPLWSRMRGLINPMLSYYWVNAWRVGHECGQPQSQRHHARRDRDPPPPTKIRSSAASGLP